MKIEKIELNRIKVTLSAPDLIDMNINIKSLTPGSPRLHGFLYEIMEKVRKETGFNPYSGQVVVEAMPDGDGIVLTVTKLTDEPQKKKRPGKVRVAGHRSAKKITYKFDSFENVCGLFSNTSPEHFASAGLYEYMDNFYMVVPKNAAPVLPEFGHPQTMLNISESFLSEHGKLHAKGKTLVAMAQGVKNLEK